MITIVTVGFKNIDEINRTCDSIDNQEGVFDIENILVISGIKEEDIIFLTRDKKKYYRKFIINQDKSIYHAMNIGISAAHGSFIFFLNAGDCFAEKDILRKIVFLIKKEKKCYLFRTMQIWGNDIYVRPSIDNLDTLSCNPAHQGFFAPLDDDTPRFREDRHIDADSIWMKSCMNIYGFQICPEVISKFYLGGVSNYPTIGTIYKRFKNQGIVFGMKEFVKFIIRVSFINDKIYYRFTMRIKKNEEQ